ncbi:hypothetical protein [Aureliella helgolandensis]|uniref:Uncharacterized protein n=1 Tax=Aureliella helgolandensis TaxID=2527968 RepID=A0A518GEM7_9BACT|nr:hypothetical protein [Aureliella helgolandensis]QDV27008.1 hypothetical protein Q31a_53890 [Aureliella helgolandensis]
MKSGYLLSIALLLASSTMASAWAGGHRCCCVCGKQVCVLEVSQAQEDVAAFEVKSKEICIPGIKFPWDKCGPRRGGEVRRVCVLEEVKKEITVCKYDWSIKTICTTCCTHHGLRHGHHAQVQQDQRVPFEYYTADLETPETLGGTNVLAGAVSSPVSRMPEAGTQVSAALTIAGRRPTLDPERSARVSAAVLTARAPQLP